MTAGPAPREALARMADFDHVGLAETALLFSLLDRPAPGSDPLGRLDALAGELDGGIRGAVNRAAALADLLARRHGFLVDDDEEADSGDFLWALDHRRGSPEMLGILWIEVADRAGWDAEALTFPGRFLVRLGGADGSRAIVDPAEGGRVVEPHDLRAGLKAMAGLAAELEPDLFAPLSNRDILLRLRNETKLRRLRAGHVAEAVALVEATLLFAPAEAALWREAGMMHMRLDNLPAAVAALEQFVARTGNAPARRRTQQLLQDIRARLQ